MQRLFYIDFLRFLAIFTVTGFRVARYIGFENLDSFGELFKNVFMMGGWLGCCLFFLISGYCLCINYNENINYFDFLKTRLLKILPVFYIAMVLWYFIIKMGIAPKPIDLPAILSHIFLVHTFSNTHFYSMSGVFWFLGVLFNFYLIFPFLYTLQAKTKYGLEILTIIVFVLSIFISYYFHIKGSAFNKSVLINLPCFTAGMLLCKKQILEIKTKCFKGLLLATTLITLFFTKSNGFMGTDINLLAIIESVLIGTLCIICKDDLEKIHIYIKNCISQIAIASYSIYLYNYIFYVSKPLCENSMIIFIYILFVFGFGICMHKIIEKPINNFVKKLIKYINV